MLITESQRSLSIAQQHWATTRASTEHGWVATGLVALQWDVRAHADPLPTA